LRRETDQGLDDFREEDREDLHRIGLGDLGDDLHASLVDAVVLIILS